MLGINSALQPEDSPFPKVLYFIKFQFSIQFITGTLMLYQFCDK